MECDEPIASSSALSQLLNGEQSKKARGGLGTRLMNQWFVVMKFENYPLIVVYYDCTCTDQSLVQWELVHVLIKV